MSNVLYRVAEIFGPTIQGEGPFVGEPCYFIRLGGCDYRCVWCDSMHAVDPEQVAKLPQMSADGIVGHLKDLGIGVDLVVLSGGNPLIWKNPELMRALTDAGYRVQIETQGSVLQYWAHLAHAIVVSPKPPSSQMPLNGKQLQAFVAMSNSYGASIYWKFVIFNQGDINFARDVAVKYNLRRIYLSVGTSPVDTAGDLIARWESLITPAMDAFRPTNTIIQIFPQMHVLLWGHKLGV